MVGDFDWLVGVWWYYKIGGGGYDFGRFMYFVGVGFVCCLGVVNWWVFVCGKSCYYLLVGV